MLSAVTLTPDRGAYLEESVAQSREDYYAGRGESPGRWHGSAATSLGLSGTVAEGSLAALIDGRHPGTGERLRRSMRARTIRVPSLDPETGAQVSVERVLEPVGGFDFVFSAPKSVSLAHALAGPAVGGQVLAAHRAAVEATLGLLEREACGVRMGAGGAERVPGSGIVAALFDHRTSRARDPQLHTHCAIANLSQGPDGKWRTLDSRLLLREWKLTLGYAYQAALRDEISSRLGWTWNEPVNGLAELDAWKPEALREFSQRRVRIEQALADRGGSGWQAGQVATLATRGRKDAGPLDVEAEREGWVARLAEHGMTASALAAALEPRSPTGERLPGDELVAAARRMAGPEGLTKRDNTFRRADVVRAWAAAHRSGTQVEHLEQLADWFLRQRALAVPLDEYRFTAPDLLRCEQRLLELVETGRGSRTAVLDRVVVDLALERASVQLNKEQQAAVRALTRSGHGIENLEALAGTGKTTVCGVIAAAYRQSGYHVLGVTPTARAARELADAGVEATTIDALLTRLRHDPVRAPRKLVILADENGMAGTRPMSELATWARQGRAKIIQVGDSGQLAAVPASGAFAAVTERYGAARLTQVHRQQDREEIDALAELRAGLPERYLAHQLRHGRVQIARDLDSAAQEAAAWWQRAADDHGPHRVALIVRTNELRRALNVAVRAQRGELDGPILETIGGPMQRNDRIVCRHNDKNLDLDNGTRATVLRVDTYARRLDVRADDGRRLRIPRAYVDAGHVEHAYALTAHTLQGATVETACVVTRPEEHGARWSYTACSRARSATDQIVIDEKEPHAGATAGVDVLARLLDAMSRDEDDQLATEHLEHAVATGRGAGVRSGNELPLRALPHEREAPGLCL